MRILHAYLDYEPSDPETKRRHTVAMASWFACQHHTFLSKGFWGTRTFEDEYNAGSPKNKKTVRRSMNYVKDIFDAASDLAAYEYEGNGIVLFTNTDICIHHSIVHASLSLPCWFQRVDFNRVPYLFDKEVLDKAPFFNAGKDGFAFTPEWWKAHRDQMPDMLLGAEGWDDCLYKIMERDGGKCVYRLLYHELHDSVWKRKECRTTIPSQVYNRKLHQEFLANWK